jgi:glycosyltransferase involved in cell wall biosynthesis
VSRALYVSAFEPQLGTGRALRTYTCVRALAILGPIDFAYVCRGDQEPSPEYQAIDGLDFIPIHPSRGLRRVAMYGLSRLRGVPDPFARALSPELAATASALALQRGRTRVVAGDPACATALLSITANRPIIHNAHNVGPINYGLVEPVNPIVLRRAMRHERQLLRAAAETWMVSRADIRAAHAMVPEARLRYVPNAVDVAAITARNGNRPARPQLLMVADFDYEPNRDARQWLSGEIMPLVWQAAPEVELQLAGRDSKRWTPPDPRIKAMGFVDRLDDLYHDTTCVVVPLRTGGGTPLKFIEAMAYAAPIVATGFAARGLDVVAGEHYTRADDTASVASAVLNAVRRGPATGTGAGRALVEREYSIQALANCIAA